MVSWHPSRDGSDPTYDEPLRMLNLGGVPPEAHADLNACLRASLQGAENTLRTGAATSVLLPPSGIIMHADGMMDMLADYEVDYYYDDGAVLTALNTMFGQVTGQAAELRCMALGYKVRMRAPDGASPQDITIAKSTEWQQKDSEPPPGTVEAVCVDLEHRAGIAVRVFMPYTYQQQRLLLGGLLSVPYQPRVWR
ncbi:hypothetical protein ABT294_32850 [Nonomuraea sp. NPDC000554]|uniref:hypothetical protein n=1 Tax=Nonomuraea sp. NPDC000554 TaxID=3154259 RepID=UPI003317B99F